MMSILCLVVELLEFVRTPPFWFMFDEKILNDREMVVNGSVAVVGLF